MVPDGSARSDAHSLSRVQEGWGTSPSISLRGNRGQIDSLVLIRPHGTRSSKPVG